MKHFAFAFAFALSGCVVGVRTPEDAHGATTGDFSIDAQILCRIESYVLIDDRTCYESQIPLF